MPASFVSTRNGEKLAYHDWPYVGIGKARAAVLIVHSHGEHKMRYQRLAQRLTHAGCMVRAYDQYGHGDSTGTPGLMKSMDHFVDDLVDVANDWRKQLPADMPLILLGHAVGSLIIALAACEQGLAMQGMVLASPMIGLRMTLVQKAKLILVRTLMPNLIVSAESDVSKCTRDPEEVLLYNNDPKINRKICVRYADFIMSSGAKIMAKASSWNIPTLLLYTDTDLLTYSSANQEFIANTPASAVEGQNFSGLYHELFNEPEREQVYRRVEQWLDRRFPKG